MVGLMDRQMQMAGWLGALLVSQVLDLKAQGKGPSSNEEEEEKEAEEEEETENRRIRVVIRYYEEESRMMRKGTLS